MSHGQRAEPRPVSVTLDNSYIGAASSLVSSFMPTRWGWGGGSSTAPDGRERILYCSFDKYDIEQTTRNCIVLTYESHIQIWDIEDSNNIYEVYSMTTEKVARFVRVLPNPLEPDVPNASCYLYGLRPALIYASGSELFLTPFLKDLSKSNLLRQQCESEILSIECNRRVVCAGGAKLIYVYDCRQFTLLKTLSACPDEPAQFSLGSRWLAFTTKQTNFDTHPLDTSSVADQLNFSTLEVAKDVGSQVASSFKYLGDLTTKAVSTYYFGDNDQYVPVDSPPSTVKHHESAGIISILDVALLLRSESSKSFSFRADTQPIAKVAFDPSGSLLCTSARGGYQINIYKLHVERKDSDQSGLSHTDKPNARKFSVTHLYNLHRGYTSATITGLFFTADSRWLTVCSSRGTCHLFAIHPEGGMPDITTHPPLGEPQQANSNEYGNDFTAKAKEKPKVVQIAALNRIKQTIHANESTPSTDSYHVCCHFLKGKSRKVFVLNQSGQLVMYQLQPHRPPTREGGGMKKLLVNIHSETEWELTRKRSWPLVPYCPSAILSGQSRPTSPTFNPSYTANYQSHGYHKDTRWANYSEIGTIGPHFTPLFLNYNTFKFKTQQSSEDLAQSVIIKQPYMPVRSAPKPIIVRNQSGNLGPSVEAHGGELSENILQALTCTISSKEKSTEINSPNAPPVKLEPEPIPSLQLPPSSFRQHQPQQQSPQFLSVNNNHQNHPTFVNNNNNNNHNNNNNNNHGNSNNNNSKKNKNKIKIKNKNDMNHQQQQHEKKKEEEEVKRESAIREVSRRSFMEDDDDDEPSGAAY